MVAIVTFHLAQSTSPADFEKLYEIDQLCYEPEIAYSRRELRNYMRFPGAMRGRGIGARKSSAFASRRTRKQWATSSRWTCFGPYPPPGSWAPHCSKKWSRRLRESRCRAIWLETATDNNEAAIAFWQKHGFTKVRIRKGYYPAAATPIR